MKTTLLFPCLAALAVLSACRPERPAPAAIGMANPASVYCAGQGGKSEIRDGENGQSGYCHLKDGRVVEEWEFYRAAHPEQE